MGRSVCTLIHCLQGRIQGGGQRGKCSPQNSELSHFSNLKLKSIDYLCIRPSLSNMQTKLQVIIRFKSYLTKELSLWNKIKYLNLNIFRTRCCKPLIFQTQIILSIRIHSLKYLGSATFGSKDIVISKSEFVAKTQFL